MCLCVCCRKNKYARHRLKGETPKPWYSCAMSIRSTASKNAAITAQIQKELADLKSTAEEAARADNVATAMPEGAANTPSFEELSNVEQSAASLGVHPDAWKPIAFMNNAHHASLLKANALDETLARRIEAFRAVSAS